jgi:YD repeat-containing protein
MRLTMRGNTASNSLSITVNAMPLVSIVTPTNLQSFVAVTNITISASASDSDGSISNVQFYCYTNLLGTVTATGTNGDYNLSWSSNFVAGAYPIIAVAMDNLGAGTASPIKVFRVNSTNIPPTVVITFPTNNEVFANGSDITITAVAAGTNSTYVTNVEFYVNGRDIGGDSASPYSINQCCWKPGTYGILAVATDNLGVSSVSTNVQITISPDSPVGGGFWDAEFASDAKASLGPIAPEKIFVSPDGTLYSKPGRIKLYLEESTDEGKTWSPTTLYLGEYENPSSMVFDGTNIYVSGADFGVIWRWNGSEWDTVGDSFSPYATVYTMAIVGGDLYVGGNFEGTVADSNVVCIAKLDAVNNRWVPVGNGVTNGTVMAIQGVGNDLYIGGSFTNAGGNTNINYIAKLQNGMWTNLGVGVTGLQISGEPSEDPWGGAMVSTMAACSSNLFVGGHFSTAGGDTNAHGIAIWNGTNWRTMDGGVQDTTNWWIYPYLQPIPNVHTISVRGNDVFVGGIFTNVLNGTNLLSANNVAKATWSEDEQRWTWTDLDGGVLSPDPFGDDTFVFSSAIHQGDSPGSYDLYFGGWFYTMGSTEVDSLAVARWRVGYPQPASIPKVTIIGPSSPAIFTNPASIFLTGLAVSSYTNIYSADFFTNGVEVGTPQDYSSNNTNIFAFTNEWDTPSPGVYLIKAVAQDDGQLIGQSQPTVISIKSSTNTITAIDDQYTILAGTPAATLQVLTNDSPSTGLKISQVTMIHNNLGTVTVDPTGTYLIYTPFPNVYGTDIFYYSVTNASNAVDSASVTVSILEPPQVAISTPDDGDIIGATANVTVTASSSDYSGNVTNMVFYLNSSFFSQTNTNSFSFNWSTNAQGFYTFIAVAIDDSGISNASSPVTIAVTNSATVTNVLIASITSLSPQTPSSGYPVVNNGLFDLQGTARDSNASDLVAYQVMLCQPDGLDTPIANVTPAPLDAEGFHQGGDSSGDLGTIDFTGQPNGIYDLELIVHGGGGQTNVTTRFILNSPLKIGQFSFSEQDIVLPVNGIPITVTRTYNSLNPLSSDFGYSWSFAINSMNVRLDETRQTVTVGSDQSPFADDETSGNGLPQTVSVRTGGGWDVSLTLPNGQQATFAFSTTSGPNYDSLSAQWTAPPWVHATLTPLDQTGTPDVNADTINFVYSPPIWGNSGAPEGSSAPLEYQDLPGWVLTTLPDNTQYYITRGNPNNITYADANYPGSFISATVYGPPQLTSIVERSRDSILITSNSVTHYDTNGSPTRAINFIRDSQNRITAIFDPNTGTNGTPTIQYVYNQDTGNLIQVIKLVNLAAGSYTTNKYHYDNASFPHYITSIENGDGIPVARNFYDDSGKLIAVQDAYGNLTQFVHNLTNNMEVVIDRLGHTNTYVYDLRGNVTAHTNALGQVMLMAYDANNNKTNEVTYLNGQPYATNNYVYDSNNLLLCSTDPLGHTNSFVYDNFGDLLTNTDARGISTVNSYDSDGNLTGNTDALNHSTVNFYGGGLLVGSVDAIGTVTTNYYNDSSEDLTATAALDASGAILSSNTFAYDLNGNRTNSTVWRRVAGSWTGATTTYIYDAQNRVVQTIDPDGGTNTVVYDAAGKQTATIDKLRRTNSCSYDDQGRLILTTYPDATTETSTYDAAGNRTNSVDRAGNATTYVYDALNRLTNTIYADSTTNTTIYDGVGRVAQTIDARGTITAFAYDAAGRRLAATNAVGIAGIQSVSSYGYDANGNQITFTDANNHTTTNVFDALNRQVQTQFPDGTKISTGYDAGGRRVAETNQDNIVTWFNYDGAGRLIAVTNALTKVTSYQYDEAGNEIAQIDALNRTNSFIYDGMGRRVAHLMPTNALVERFNYDLAGNMILDTNFNGVIITNQYDVMNRLTNQSSVNGYNVSFTYSPTGQRTNMIDASGTNSYAYDNRDRLQLKTVNWIGGPGVSLNYLYDANGNVTNLWSSASGGVSNVYQYDALNRLTNVLANGSAIAGYNFVPLAIFRQCATVTASPIFTNTINLIG